MGPWGCGIQSGLPLRNLKHSKQIPPVVCQPLPNLTIIGGGTTIRLIWSKANFTIIGGRTTIRLTRYIWSWGYLLLEWKWAKVHIRRGIYFEQFRYLNFVFIMKKRIFNTWALSWKFTSNQYENRPRGFIKLWVAGTWTLVLRVLDLLGTNMNRSWRTKKLREK